jgi:hypothetical protein
VPATPPQPVNNPVNNARSAVENAYSATPFNPAGQPVQSLNAQPISSQPIHQEAPPAPISMPQMPNSDTPMLVLPTDNNSSVTATQPIATQLPTENTMPAPPPVPPPLMTGNGGVIPNQPQQQ